MADGTSALPQDSSTHPTVLNFTNTLSGTWQGIFIERLPEENPHIQMTACEGKLDMGVSDYKQAVPNQTGISV